MHRLLWLISTRLVVVLLIGWWLYAGPYALPSYVLVGGFAAICRRLVHE